MILFSALLPISVVLLISSPPPPPNPIDGIIELDVQDTTESYIIDASDIEDIKV